MNKVLLGDVAEEVRENYKATDGNPAVVGLEHLIPGEIRLKEWSEDTNTTFTKAFHKGQVLFGRRRAYLKKAAVAPVDGICSGDITVISAKQDKILSELLPFVIQNDDFFDFAVGKSAGSLSPRVKWSRLKEYEFNLPSLPQQKKLAKLLWSFVDTKEAYEDLIRQTDELVKSQFIEMFGDPRTNPMKWPVKNFNEIATSKIGLTYKPEDIKDGGILVLRSGNIQDSKISLNDNVYVNVEVKEDLLVKKNDILMCSRNGSAALVGKVALIPEFDSNVTFGAFMTVIRSRYYDYLFEYFQQPAFREQISAGTSTINQITQKMLSSINIPIPSEALQKQFKVFREQSDKSKFELNEAIKDLDAMYKRVIKDNLG